LGVVSIRLSLLIGKSVAVGASKKFLLGQQPLIAIEFGVDFELSN
jgi:hypothetical protein